MDGATSALVVDIDEDVNEVLLLHGTAVEKVPSIMPAGFDERKAFAGVDAAIIIAPRQRGHTPHGHVAWFYDHQPRPCQKYMDPESKKPHGCCRPLNNTEEHTMDVTVLCTIINVLPNGDAGTSGEKYVDHSVGMPATERSSTSASAAAPLNFALPTMLLRASTLPPNLSSSSSSSQRAAAAQFSRVAEIAAASALRAASAEQDLVALKGNPQSPTIAIGTNTPMIRCMRSHGSK